MIQLPDMPDAIRAKRAAEPILTPGVDASVVALFGSLGIAFSTGEWVAVWATAATVVLYLLRAWQHRRSVESPSGYLEQIRQLELELIGNRADAIFSRVAWVP